jgi:hypothetical protein
MDGLTRLSRGAIRLPLLIIAILLIAIAAVAGVIFLPDILNEPSPGLPSSDEPSPSYEVFVNEEAGYRFEYPSGWTVSRDGTVSRATSDDGRAVVSFGVAPRGDLLVASDRLVELLRDSYRKLRPRNEDVGSINGNLAVLRSGLANNGREELRYRVVLVSTEEGNLPFFWADFAITSFVSRTDPRYTDEIEQIIQSFAAADD